MAFVRAAVKNRALKRRLLRMRDYDFREVRLAVVDQAIAQLPSEMERSIKRGKFRVAPLKPRTIRRKAAKGAPRPEVPLFDTGGYAESWVAVKRVRRRGRGWEVSALMDPQGENANGIPYTALVRILEYGFSGQLPRPHIAQFTQIADRFVRRLLREEVERVLRS